MEGVFFVVISSLWDVIADTFLNPFLNFGAVVGFRHYQVISSMRMKYLLLCSVLILRTA